MKLLYAIVPVACLPGGLVTAKSTKLQTQSYSNGPSSIDEWVNLGKKQLGQGKAKESAASYRKALKVFYRQRTSLSDTLVMRRSHLVQVRRATLSA